MISERTFAIILMLFSTSLMNIAMVFQKKGISNIMVSRQIRDKLSLRLLLKEPIWIWGWAVALTAILFNCLALGKANLSTLQPLVGFGLVVMVIFSRFYLKEIISRIMLVGIFLVISGIILLTFTCIGSVTYFEIGQVTMAYIQTSSIVTFIVYILSCLLLYRLGSKSSGALAGVLFSILAAMISVLGLTLCKGLFVTIAIAGIMKSFIYWGYYLLFMFGQLLSLIAFIILQISFSKCKAVVAMPVFQVISIITPLILGPILFNEQLNWYFFPSTILITIGILTIYLGNKKIDQLL